ncbi:MAG: phosphomannomutase/phosphoglucomutase [Pseudomonadota bacterium]|nr:phosphomannomutase/phosphoglucomutase [Pseudomonadota bacterium]
MSGPYQINNQPCPEIFRAYDIRGIVDKTLFTNDYYAIGRVFAALVKEAGRQKVVVGRDVRYSSPQFYEAMVSGLIEGGVEVVYIGEVPTPVLNYATKFVSPDGIMITASHNPKDYNGIKLYMDGVPLPAEIIDEIKKRINANNFGDLHELKSVETLDVKDRYIAEMKERIKIKRPLKIVIDGGNGIAGVIVESLYRALGMNVIPLFCEPDGQFPNHHPNPGDPKNLVDLQQKVQDEKADLGLAFDGDADRLGVVTSTGIIVWPDQLMLLLSKHLLSKKPGAKIVFDVKCENYLTDLIIKWGGQPIMWQTGHSKIRRKMVSSDAEIGGEMSGHIFLPYYWYDFDDAFAAGAVLLQLVANENVTLDDIISFVPQTFSTHELIVNVEESKKFQIIEDFIKNIDYKDVEINTIDGVRLSFNDGWAIIRASNTTNALTLRYSALSQARLDEIKMQIEKKLHAVDPTISFDC